MPPVEASYIPVKPPSGLIHIGGNVRSRTVSRCSRVVPGDDRVARPVGRARGMPDGVPVDDAASGAGRRALVPSADSGLAVGCFPALQRGLEPGELFTTDDR